MDNQQADSPLVSVIIPAYNAESFIERTIQSVLNQTYKNIEIIVVDDGSQDRTSEIVKEIAQQENCLRLLHQPNLGVAAARNLGICNSKGEFIAPIDADDIWYPRNLEKQVNTMLTASSVGMVYSWSVDIDEEDRLTGGFHTSPLEGNIYNALIYRNFIGNASATLIRRSCFEKVGKYDSQFKEQNAQGCEDWDLYLRIANVYKIRVVPEFLVGYRQLIGSMSSNYSSMSKSHWLLLADIQKRLDTDESICRLSRSNFYIYLAIKSSRSGNHWNTLTWLYKAWRSSWKLFLLSHYSYTLSVSSLLKLIAQPATSLVWEDHRSWINFRKSIGRNKKLTLVDVNQRMKLQRLLPTTYFEERLFRKLSQNTSN